MKKYINRIEILFTSIIITCILLSCSTVPLTGRKQVNLLPESEMLAMSFSQYNQFLKENKISTNQKQSELIKHVGGRIATAVEKYMNEKGLASQIKDYAWDFNLVEDKTPNAWCMPGGKVVFYTGILPYTKDEDGLAVVMGHEIAHAIARHGNERLSHQLGVQLGGLALSAAIDEKPEETQMLYMAAFGLGSQVGFMLPYSRLHETEADKMGLVFMAMAGYNPRAAVPFWERMAASGGQKPPEFLSTHPADQTRIQNLKTYMPEALKYYNQ